MVTVLGILPDTTGRWKENEDGGQSLCPVTLASEQCGSSNADSGRAVQALCEQPSLAFTCAGIYAHRRWQGPSGMKAEKGGNK